jgi:hypothetical protein
LIEPDHEIKRSGQGHVPPKQHTGREQPDQERHAPKDQPPFVRVQAGRDESPKLVHDPRARQQQPAHHAYLEERHEPIQKIVHDDRSGIVLRKGTLGRPEKKTQQTPPHDQTPHQTNRDTDRCPNEMPTQGFEVFAECHDFVEPRIVTRHGGSSSRRRMKVERETMNGTTDRIKAVSRRVRRVSGTRNPS